MEKRALALLWLRWGLFFRVGAFGLETCLGMSGCLFTGGDQTGNLYTGVFTVNDHWPGQGMGSGKRKYRNRRPGHTATGSMPSVLSRGDSSSRRGLTFGYQVHSIERLVQM